MPPVTWAVRALLGLLLLSVSLPASADRLITVPMGTKIRDGFLKADYLYSTANGDSIGRFGYGFGQTFEAAWTLDNRMTSRGPATSVDLAYNHVPPIIDISPGLTVGVRDLMDITPEGFAAYAAFTWRFGNFGTFNQETPTELTMGLWTQSSGVGFVGFSMPFFDELRLIGEHDSQRLTAGFEVRPVPGLGARMLFRSGDVLFGAHLSARF